MSQKRKLSKSFHRVLRREACFSDRPRPDPWSFLRMCMRQNTPSVGGIACPGQCISTPCQALEQRGRRVGQAGGHGVEWRWFGTRQKVQPWAGAGRTDELIPPVTLTVQSAGRFTLRWHQVPGCHYRMVRMVIAPGCVRGVA